jgi:VWFA-related protein
MMMRPFYCSICVLFALIAPLTAQERPQTPTSTLRVTTRLVVIDVSVLDRSGHFVPNLDASAFTVYEDKTAQKIRNFEGPAGHAMPSIAPGHPLVLSSADLRRIGNAPVNILVFDELNTPFNDVAYARQMMERYLKKQPEVLPVPTLLVAAGDTRFIVLHDYTQSRAALQDAIRHHLPEYASQMMRGGDSQMDRIAQTLGSLEQIADSSRGTPGRKNVIWIGAGYPSLDLTDASPADKKKVEAVIRTVTARMLAARVTLYTVDPEGVAPHDLAPVGLLDPSTYQGDMPTTGPYAGKLDFQTFALATGGRIYSGRNDLDNEIGDGLTQGGQYYTLSYRPTNLNDDATAYRNIRVLMKDPNLRAVTRDGYFGGTAPVEHVSVKGQQATQLDFDVASSANSLLVYNGLHVQVTTAPGGFRIATATRDLTLTTQDDGSRQTEITVVAVAFDAKNRVLAQKAREIKEGLRAGKQSEAITLLFPFDVPAGSTRIRFIVRDAATGNLGSADLKP